MKRLVFLFLLLCVMALPALAEETVVIVATDLHYLSPALTDNGPFFTNLVETADGKVMLYVDPLCDAFVEQVIAREPDCLILSGDLTFNGEKQSHIDLAAKLQRVEAAGIPVLVLPGNHDLNTSAHAFHGDGYSRTASVTAGEFRSIYAAMGFDEALSCDEASLSFVYQLSPGWRILMLDANTPEAPGAIRPETLAWVEAQLDQAVAEGARIIAVSHQNLLGHNALFTAGYVISNHDDLAALYAGAPVVCNLSGHMHMQHSMTDAPTPEIATSALSVYPNQYGVLTLGEDAVYGTERVDVSAWAVRQGMEDGNLLDFAAYSERFFKTIAVNQAQGSVRSDEDIPGLAAWFADLNACYFSGRMDLADLSGDEYERWRRQPVFLAAYIDSILMEEARDHTRVQLAIE